MRFLAACLVLAACNDQVDAPTTIVHVQVTVTCATEPCEIPADLFANHCGLPADLIEGDTREAEVSTGLDAERIAGFIQVQYSGNYLPAGAPPDHHEHVLESRQHADVYAGYGVSRHYRLTPGGEVVDVDPTFLVAATDNMLQFAYAADGSVSAASVVEDHVIDAPRTVHLDTDEPGIMDSCCAVGRPADLGVVLLVLAFGLRRRRRPVTPR